MELPRGGQESPPSPHPIVISTAYVIGRGKNLDLVPRRRSDLSIRSR